MVLELSKITGGLMLNKVIINTFDKLADEEGLSEVAKTNIKNYLIRLLVMGKKIL